MLDELWNDVLARLVPNIACFSDDEAVPLMNQIGPLFMPNMPVYGSIDWGKYPKHARFNEASEILPLLEKLLERPFDDTVYVYSPDNYVDILKVPLRKFLEGRYRFLTPMWLWNPVEGYMIEERSIGYATVGLIPQMDDPFLQHELKKDCFCEGFFSFRHFFRNLTLDFGIEIFYEKEADKILMSLQNILPFTGWVHINWDNVETKIMIGHDQSRIIPELKKLLGTIKDFAVYIEWHDADLPLIKTDIRHILAHYRQLIAPSLETLLFNTEAGYVIEINAANNITIGLLPRNNA